MSLSHMTREAWYLQSLYIWSSDFASQKGDAPVHHISGLQEPILCHHHLEALEEPLFRMPLVSYETALSITLTLSLLCFARRNPVRRRCPSGIPFAVEELVPFSRHWFHCRPAHSLLWPALLSSFNGSRKTFQIPRDDQPIFIALLGILDLLYFVLISLYL